MIKSFILSREIEEYVEEHTSEEKSLVKELEKETIETTQEAQMMCGRVEGQFLQMLIRLSGARNVVEIGTFTGYSTLMMAEGLPEDGRVITCEISEEYARIARKYIDRSPNSPMIDIKIGPALETLKYISSESIDFVFIDADKTSYCDYYDESMRIVKKGGLIAVDNALWSGRVLRPEDDDSRAIALFNNKVKEDPRSEKVLLTVRDGIYLIRKKL
jgi:caffeoyl-CoA O-methyltransferase